MKYTFNYHSEGDINEKKSIHFLHIGKNAGTEIVRYANKINDLQDKFEIFKHKHDVRLVDLPKNEEYFFSIRNPISRFISGFNSRKRKGQPRLYVEWSNNEKIAFNTFENPNDLAESLYEDGELGYKALQAIKSIRHTSMNQIDWFNFYGYFFITRPPLAIIRQEYFEDDITKLMSILKIDPFVIKGNIKDSHITEYSEMDKFLSEKAKNNLKNWYKNDFEFYKICSSWILDNMY